MDTTSLNRDSESDFLEFAGEILPHSFSQRLQDLWALWESGFARSGYFVEFGALNGKDFSNSYLLEQLGWNGVVAEPHPDYVKILQENRSCAISTKCVFSESGKTVSFHAVKGRPALSSIGGFGEDDDKSLYRKDHITHQVETISLIDLLRESNAPTSIDFMSVDTEGSEHVILDSFNFEAYQIKCICVEHNLHQRDDLHSLLSRNGYIRKWVGISGHDDWYVHAASRSDWDTIRAAQLMATLKQGAKFERSLPERLALIKQLKPTFPNTGTMA